MTPNRLVHEKSPYLLQHAYNPVDWRPWGEEAFAAAREQDKPIFLSVGYSTCHWCHVMERESFENQEVAALLNRDFISIKLDREERPDVDRVYMLFVQATSGSGGWPMSVFLTPELKPFYGGTYFPPENRYNRPGFKTLLTALANAWKNERAKILDSADGVLAQLQSHATVEPGEAAIDSQRIAESTFFHFRRSFDSQRGGFGSAPKFPRPASLHFLLRHYALTGNEESLDMVAKTLYEMALGGMNDQLGGGFHRYSVDAQWFVPHFEKMLYDQAQLAISYLEAYQITRNEAFAHITREIFDYVLRDLRHPEGGFYSAEDADSVIDAAHPHEKGEGAFYVWTWEELEAIVGAERMPWFVHRYGVERPGNVHEDPHGEFTGKNILYLSEPNSEPLDMELWERLMAARAKRVHPHLDDKILTSWNGLMISAFALGGRVLAEPRYRDAAEAAIGFLANHLVAPNGVLLRRWREGEAAIPGFLDDYAFLAQGLLDSYEATGQLSHLEWARRLATDMLDIFEDRVHGGFFSSAETDESLVLRIKDDYDGAEPSGNSIALSVLVRLSGMTGEQRFRAAAERCAKAFSTRLAQQSATIPYFVTALLALEGAPRQIVLAGKGSQELEAVVNQRFLPFHTRLYLRTEADRDFFAWSPALAAMQPIEGEPAAYVCENFTCQFPVRNGTELVRLLQ